VDGVVIQANPGSGFALERGVTFARTVGGVETSGLFAYDDSAGSVIGLAVGTSSALGLTGRASNSAVIASYGTGSQAQSSSLESTASNGADTVLMSLAVITQASGTKQNKVSIGLLQTGSGFPVPSFEAGDMVSRFGFGDVAEPSYSFLGDQDTGMYHSATNTLAFATGGTLRLTVDSGGATVANDLEVSGVTILGGNSDNVGRIKPVGFHTVADNGTLSLGEGTGFLFVQNSTSAHGALYYLRSTAAIELLDSNGTFSITSGTGSSNNIYHDGSVWRIENKRGSSQSYHVIWLGLSSNF
jgi:hypothetical protein